MSDFVTVAEAAERLGMRESLLLRWMKDRRLTGWVDWCEIESKMRPVPVRARS